MTWKYRIKEKNDRFYPQERIFLFWEYMFVPWYKVHPDQFWADGYTELFFNTKEEAESFIELKKKCRKVTIHKVQ